MTQFRETTAVATDSKGNDILSPFYSDITKNVSNSNVLLGVSDKSYNRMSAVNSVLLTADFARSYTAKFKAVRDSFYAKNAILQQRFNVCNAELFNKDAIIALLNVNGSQGIRISLGQDTKGIVRMVLAPVDSAIKNINAELVPVQLNNPILPQFATMSIITQRVEDGQRCPTMCSYNGL